MAEQFESCSLCARLMPAGDHQVCRQCILENRWNPTFFGWKPITVDEYF